MNATRRSKYYFNPPLLLKKMFPNFIWNSPCGKIILTFDDGPNPKTTPLILKILEQNNADAIFFTVGENLARHKTLANEIIERGHTLGNHAQNHAVLTKLNKKEVIEQISLVQNFARDELNYEVKFFRPPHGRFPINLAKTLNLFGLKNVMWSLLTYDYENNFNMVKFAIENFLRQDSVVVFHDNDKSAEIIEESLNYLFEKASEKGFEFGKVAKCLK